MRYNGYNVVEKRDGRGAMPTATVSKVGNSRAVFIPAGISDEAFAIGSKVEIEYVGEGTLVVRAMGDDRKRRREALGRLLGLVDEQPVIPWEDDSRAADRALVGGRYA